MGFRAVCIENRAKCHYEGGYMVVTQADITTSIHLSEIASVMFCTNQVYMSGWLLSELAKHKIPVIICDEKQQPVAQSLPLYGAYNCPAQLAQQLDWSAPTKKRLWQQIVRHKIQRQTELLEMTEHDRQAQLLREYAADVCSGDTTNREAAAAGLYFPTLFGDGFSRDIDCDTNASLNYGYSILLSKVSREIVSHGFLTQMGVNHRGELNQWNFACDLMEPFRPFVDYLVFTAGIERFCKEMRRLLANMMSKLVLYRDGEYKLSSVIKLYINDCAKVLNRELSPDELESYTIV